MIDHCNYQINSTETAYEMLFKGKFINLNYRFLNGK